MQKFNNCETEYPLIKPKKLFKIVGIGAETKADHVAERNYFEKLVVFLLQDSQMDQMLSKSILRVYIIVSPKAE